MLLSLSFTFERTEEWKKTKKDEFSHARKYFFSSRRSFRRLLFNRPLTFHFPFEDYFFDGDFVKATSTAICEGKARFFSFHERFTRELFELVFALELIFVIYMKFG